MPLTFLHNERGVFRYITASSGIGDHVGWWNSITACDVDNDGDMDYIVGNLGKNSFYRASKEYPVRVYGKDFDKNGIYDMIPSLYLPDAGGVKKEFPAASRDDLLKQINAMRKKFPDYRSYAVADMDQVLSAEERKGALILGANDFASSLIRNDGNGRFSLVALPAEAQLSVVNGMVAADFDGDGNADLAMSGNDYGTEVTTGRYDAFNGLYLSGDGRGGFLPRSILQSGLYIPGNGKALVQLRGAGGCLLLAAGQNRGPLKIFELRRRPEVLELRPDDVSVMLHFRNGKKRMEEASYGSSFLSQSGRFICLGDSVGSAEVVDGKGRVRVVSGRRR